MARKRAEAPQKKKIKEQTLSSQIRILQIVLHQMQNYLQSLTNINNSTRQKYLRYNIHILIGQYFMILLAVYEEQDKD
jgi:hypothetical protein